VVKKTVQYWLISNGLSQLWKNKKTESLGCRFHYTTSNKWNRIFFFSLDASLWVFWKGFCIHFSAFPCMLHAPPISSPWCSHPDSVWLIVQVMRLLVMRSSPASCHFLPLAPGYSLQHPVFMHFRCVKAAGKIVVLCILTFGVLQRGWEDIRFWTAANITVHFGDKLVKLYLLRSVAGIAQWYSTGLWAGWSEVWALVGARNFSPHHRIQTGSGAHRASYTTVTKGSLPGGKVAKVWSWPLTSI
jgi:hypothetical protein